MNWYKFSTVIKIFLAGLFAITGIANAVDLQYPNKPIRMIVPFPPGGGADIIARTMSQKFTEAVSQQIIIDNRAGAGGIIGLEIAAHAPPDGYTILLAPSGPMVIHPGLYKKLSYHTIRDFEPISLLISTPLILLVSPNLSVQTTRELIQYAARYPSKLNYASVGKGGSSHLATELLMQMTGINMVHIAYKGLAPAISGFLGGEVQLMFGSAMASLPYIRSAKLRAIAVSTIKRTAALPQLPTIAESGVPGYATGSWYGLLAPVSVSTKVVNFLHLEFSKIIKNNEFKERLISEGSDPVGSTPYEFKLHIRQELTRWASVIDRAQIKIE